MTAIEKAPASAATLTRAIGINQPVDTSFDYNTACHIWQVMCELLGQQEGVQLTAKVSRKASKQAG